MLKRTFLINNTQFQYLVSMNILIKSSSAALLFSSSLTTVSISKTIEQQLQYFESSGFFVFDAHGIAAYKRHCFFHDFFSALQ